MFKCFFHVFFFSYCFVRFINGCWHFVMITSMACVFVCGNNDNGKQLGYTHLVIWNQIAKSRQKKKLHNIIIRKFSIRKIKGGNAIFLLNRFSFSSFQWYGWYYFIFVVIVIFLSFFHLVLLCLCVRFIDNEITKISSFTTHSLAIINGEKRFCYEPENRV